MWRNMHERRGKDMGINEQEALAEQLCALFDEAIGEPRDWDSYNPEHREAWTQVAQFVEARYHNAYGVGTGWGVLLSGYDEPDHK